MTYRLYTDGKFRMQSTDLSYIKERAREFARLWMCSSYEIRASF